MRTTTAQDSPDTAVGAVDELGDAVVALVRACRCVARRATEHSHSALAVLEMARLLGSGERRLSELAELRGVDQSVISRQVTELVQRGLLSRRPDPNDKRASLVRLAPEGLAVLERARTLRQDWLRSALARSPVDDVRTTARLVAALAAELLDRVDELEPLTRTPTAGTPRIDMTQAPHATHDENERGTGS